MAKVIVKTVFQLKRGLSAAWKRNNPLLQAAEPGYETDTGKLKIGNGQDLWNDLPYFANNTFSEEDAEKINTAINEALLKAKESGEFNGAQGPKGDKGDPGPQGVAGKDGYTPIKGKDYFDGKDGSQGPKGDKGEKGNQGEPGVNGKDGKDGAKGEPGAKGNDGVSATHSWQGTVLTISSASGISSVDLKGDKGEKGDTGQDGISVIKTEINQNGELIFTFSNNTTSNLGVVVGAKGEPGQKGDQGDPYTLTENDKQEIANLVLTLIPDGDEVEY